MTATTPLLKTTLKAKKFRSALNNKYARINVGPKKTHATNYATQLFDDEIVLKLSNAMGSYIRIKQINGESGDITHNKLQKLLKQCTAKKRDCDCVWLLTRVLHNHNKVRRELGDEDDEINVMMRHIQSTNDLSTHFLNENGFYGSAFQVQINGRRRNPHGQLNIPGRI